MSLDTILVCLIYHFKIDFSTNIIKKFKGFFRLNDSMILCNLDPPKQVFFYFSIHKKTKDSQQLNIEILSCCESLYLCG